jgi:hypothetical protein
MFAAQPVPAPDCYTPKAFQTIADVEDALMTAGFVQVKHPSGTVWIHDTDPLVHRRLVKIVEV